MKKNKKTLTAKKTVSMGKHTALKEKKNLNNVKPSKPETVAQMINRVTKEMQERAITTIEVLNKTIYISNQKTILRMGHSSKNIEGNKLFYVLDKKIQEMMVIMVSELTKDEIDLEGDKRYFDADRKAIEFVLNKYSATPKKYWIMAYLIIFDTATNSLNFERLKKIMAFMKLNNDKEAKKIKTKFKNDVEWGEKIKDKVNGESLSYDDGGVTLHKEKNKKKPVWFINNESKKRIKELKRLGFDVVKTPKLKNNYNFNPMQVDILPRKYKNTLVGKILNSESTTTTKSKALKKKK